MQDRAHFKEGREAKQVRMAARGAFWVHMARYVRLYAGNLEHLAEEALKKRVKETGKKTF